MNIKKPIILMTAVLVVVAATTTFAKDSAFAQSDEENQGASGVNVCDNSFCQNLISQIQVQGDMNDVYIVGSEDLQEAVEDAEDAAEDAADDPEFADAEFE
jgi:hypothetical protein